MTVYQSIEQFSVNEFHRACRHVAPNTPQALDEKTARLRVRLIVEEAYEFKDAVEGGNYLEMIDALCDLNYVLQGAAVSMGVDLQPFFVEVHMANMNKTKGGKDAGGKQMKPPGWQPPDHRKVWEQNYVGEIPVQPPVKCDLINDRT